MHAAIRDLIPGRSSQFERNSQKERRMMNVLAVLASEGAYRWIWMLQHVAELWDASSTSQPELRMADIPRGDKDMHWNKYGLWKRTAVLTHARMGLSKNRQNPPLGWEFAEGLSLWVTENDKGCASGFLFHRKKTCQLIAAEQEDSVIQSLIRFPGARNFHRSLPSAPRNAQPRQTTSCSAALTWPRHESPTVLIRHLSKPNQGSSVLW